MAKKITEVTEPTEVEVPVADETPVAPPAPEEAVLATPVKEYSFSVKVYGFVRVQAPSSAMAEEHVKSMTLEEFAENRAKIQLVSERTLTGDNI